MADIIRLLPDFVANQIAAGEVIQRPASVVKELMENAIDAGAQTIKLIIKDSGRALIQVIDDGCGMSASDARLAFERHATSKISSADDLFRIRTKGFRGEALASIASVAQVDLRTRLTGEELGTQVIIEGSEVKAAEPCQTAVGTSFAVKNLFFNVPARRQFLKSDHAELKHILDEFQRIALAHSDIAMTMHHNNSEVYHLLPGNLRQRIVQLFGQKYDERLVPVEEDTDVLGVGGFVGRPEFAKKGRGEQFFFVNGRFIKHPYLHHALMSAFDGLLSEGKHPFYVVHLSVDPSRIDVNIHPTKTEVKFREERAIYPILKSAIRRGLGKFQVAPTLDFEQESSFNIAPFDKDRPVVMPEVNVNPDYNPFAAKSSPLQRHSGGSFTHSRQGRDDWSEYYKSLTPDYEEQEAPKLVEAEHDEGLGAIPSGASMFQVSGAFIVCPMKGAMMVIDQQRAHERVLFEELIRRSGEVQVVCQRLLFPETLTLSANDHAQITASSELLQSLGFDVENLGGRDIVVHGVPPEAQDVGAETLIESVIEALDTGGEMTGHPLHQRMAAGLARGMAVRRGKQMSETEMRDLIDRLFMCEVPTYSPTGRPAIVTFTPEEIARKFR